MNATSLYVATCRLILQAKVDEPSSLLDLYKLFPLLRTSLSCSVCGNLLMEPYTPTESTCEHHVCKTCKGGRKKLKPSCSWCKDYGLYVENVQLRILLQCYKKLCQYVTSSEIYRTLSTLPGPSNNTSNNNSTTTVDSQGLIRLIKEGTGFKDEFKSGNDIFLGSLGLNRDYTTTATQTGDNEQTSKGKEKNSLLQNGVSPVYSVCATSGNRLTLKRAGAEDTSGLNGDSTDGNNCPTTRMKGRRKRPCLEPGIVTKCQCQMTTARSSCRGYRCPCYSADRPCTDCACRACNNPLGFNKITESSIGTTESSAELNSSTI